MSYVKIDDRRRIMDAREESGDGWIDAVIDMRGWELFDDGVPKYKLTDDNWVKKRSDAEIKWDKKHPDQVP